MNQIIALMIRLIGVILLLAPFILLILIASNSANNINKRYYNRNLYDELKVKVIQVKKVNQNSIITIDYSPKYLAEDERIFQQDISIHHHSFIKRGDQITVFVQKPKSLNLQPDSFSENRKDNIVIKENTINILLALLPVDGLDLLRIIIALSIYYALLYWFVLHYAGPARSIISMLESSTKQ